MALPQAAIAREVSDDAALSSEGRSDGLRLVINWILDFLASPLGFIAEMTLIVVVLLWAIVRTTAALRQRALAIRRAEGVEQVASRYRP
jgi:hypothetical protein